MQFARKHSMEEQAEQKKLEELSERKKLEELSLREIRRLQELDLSKGPPLTAPLPPLVSSVDSMPVPPVAAAAVKEELPTYDISYV